MKDNNYKILFVPTKNPGPQNDLLEVSILNGLRNIMGENCVDYPRKKIMYHDFTESPSGTITRTAAGPPEVYDDNIFLRARGRQMSLRIENEATGVKWRLGAPRLDARADGRR